MYAESAKACVIGFFVHIKVNRITVMLLCAIPAVTNNAMK